MSDTTIRPWLAPSRGSATVPFDLRARVAAAAGRNAVVTLLDAIETYGLIEASCLLAAVGFCAVFIATAFGVRV
jgi:hypothetical protein